ncbi:unnamed protein product, partial [Laminaria digitata]
QTAGRKRRPSLGKGARQQPGGLRLSLSARTPVCSSCFPQLAREAPPPLVIPAAQEEEEEEEGLSEAGLSIPHHHDHLVQSSTREANTTQLAARKSSPSCLVVPSDSLKDNLPKTDEHFSGIERNDQEEPAKTGRRGGRSVITPSAGSVQQSTIALPRKFSQGPRKFSQGPRKLSQGVRKISEGHTE